MKRTFQPSNRKRKMPATGYIPEGDIVICCVNLLAGFVSFQYRKKTKVISV